MVRNYTYVFSDEKSYQGQYTGEWSRGWIGGWGEADLTVKVDLHAPSGGMLAVFKMV